MYKKVLLVIILSFSFFICGCGNKAAVKKESKQTPVKENQQSSSNKTTEETPAENNTSNSDDIICKYGEEKVTGKWNIKVLDTKESTEETIEDGKKKTTSEKFITVKLKLENKSSSPAQWNPNDFTLLEGSTSSKYSANFDVTEGIGSRETIFKNNDKVLGMYTDLNPGLSKECYICFEVPKECNIDDCSIAYIDQEANQYCGYLLK